MIVRDLGSTNGIRINGQRVELGRLRPGDELSIAHIRYRLENGQGHEATLVDSHRETKAEQGREREWERAPVAVSFTGPGHGLDDGLPVENRLAAAVREQLPTALANHCRIQVIIQQLPNEENDNETDSTSHPSAELVSPADANPPEEGHLQCQPDSSH